MKINFRRKEKGSVFSVWIMSYLFILLIPMVFGTSIYLYALNTVRKQADVAQRETLHSVVEISDRTLENIQESTYAVLRTSLVENLGMISGEYTVSQYQDMATLQNSIYKLKANSSYISEIYLYFTKTEYMLSTYSYSRANTGSFLTQSGMTQEQFRELITDTHYRTLRIFPSYKGESVYLINSELVMSGKKENPRVVMFVQLDVNALRDMMQLEASTTWLVDERGQAFMVGDGKMSEPLQELAEDGEEGFWKFKDSYVRSMASEEFQLLYINEQSKKLYFGNVNRMAIILVVYLLICLTVGGALAVMMAKKQYNPVQEILTTIQKANLTPEEKGDMERIKSSIEQLLSEKENFRQRLESQKRALRSTVMYNLIKGRHLERYVMEGIPYYRGEFRYQGGFLIAFDVEDASKAFFEEHDDLDDDLLDLVFYVVENIAEELLAEKYPAFVSEADGVMLCLVNIPEQETMEAEKALSALAGTIVDFMTEKFAVRLSVGISGWHENWSGIERCYYDIQDLMDYRNINGTEQPVMIYSELEAFWQNQDSESQTLNRQVQELLGEGAYEKAIQLIGSRTAIPAADESADRQQDAIMDSRAEGREGRLSSGEIIEQVQRYIHENYRDKDLSVGKIADEFGISLSYLSQIFKRTMKIGLLEYIHLQRIEEAKKLLLEGQSVQSVAERVGYYNTRPLIRMFKRLENMTPTEYKEAKKSKTGKEA